MNALEQLDRVREQIAASTKRRFVCLATTANLNNPPFHVGGLRHTPDTIAASFLFGTLDMLAPVIEPFDGVVERFFVDCEVKNHVADLLPRALELAHRSEVSVFKPNDITVEALDAWLAELRADHSGRLVAIAGVGNIGAKIALRLTERGAVVRLAGRDRVKLTAIAGGLSAIVCGRGRLEVEADLTAAARDADLLLGCTPGVPVIDAAAVASLAPQATIIDAGNGTVSDDGLRAAAERSIQVLCLTPTAGWQGFVACRDAAGDQLGRMGSRRLSNDLLLITPGILGPRGAVLVDDIDGERQIIGVCDGRGDIMPPDEAAPFLRLLEQHDHRD